MAKKFAQKGFSLIEIVFAVFVFSVISLGSSYLLLDTVKASRLNMEKVQAEFLAREALEIVKTIGSEEWQNLTAGQYGLSLSNNVWQLTPENEDVSSILNQGERFITIADVDDSLKSITAQVNWQGLTSEFKSDYLITYLSDWEQKQLTECSDGIDNDGDGDIDYPADSGCYIPQDPSEEIVEGDFVCIDEIDKQIVKVEGGFIYLHNCQLTGNVLKREGTVFVCRQSTINGNLDIEDPANVELDQTTISGNVSMSYFASDVNLIIYDNDIDGDLVIDGGTLSLVNNRVGGKLDISCATTIIDNYDNVIDKKITICGEEIN